MAVCASKLISVKDSHIYDMPARQDTVITIISAPLLLLFMLNYNDGHQ